MACWIAERDRDRKKTRRCESNIDGIELLSSIFTRSRSHTWHQEIICWPYHIMNEARRTRQPHTRCGPLKFLVLVEKWETFLSPARPNNRVNCVLFKHISTLISVRNTEKNQCSRTLALTCNQDTQKCQFTGGNMVAVCGSPSSIHSRAVCSLAFSRNVRLIPDTARCLVCKMVSNRQ